MGLPSINLVSPANQVNLTVTISPFDAIYSDNKNQLIASSVKFEIDTVSTFDSSNKITSEYLNVEATIPLAE